MCVVIILNFKIFEMGERIRVRTTKRQLEALVAFIESNKELAENKKVSQTENIATQLKWEELTENLNNLDGPKRRGKEWKQVFNDLKTNTRRRARVKKYDIGQTGGGSAKEKPLTNLEQRILNVLSSVVIDGAPAVGEPGLAVDDIPLIERDDESMESEEIQELVLETGRPTPEPTPLNDTVQRRQARTRKRRMTPAEDSTNKLIRSQENLAEAIRELASSIRYAADRH